MGSLTYLAIDLISVAFPLLASFETRLRFWKNWPGLFLGIAVMMVFFVPWDVAFTAEGIWGFNEAFLIGIEIAGLPIEEWLFFLLISYSCIFLYEVMRYFISKDLLGPSAKWMSGMLSAVLLIIALFHIDQAYTFITFLSTSLVLGVHAFLLKSPWLGRFFIGYAVSLVPFFLVNGILTGSWIEEPIVWYNDQENLGLRLGTIPIEDPIYLMLMLLIVTTVYEWKRSK